MKIRESAAAGDSRATENTFIAVDDLENRIGSCRVTPTHAGETMPDRPCEIKICAEGEPGALQQLLGAALTRAFMLARDSGLNALVYAECAPDDEAQMELYRSIGLKEEDALVRMRRKAVAGPSVARLPEGCALVQDRLQDDHERAFFLERQKQLFRRENAEEWLSEIMQKPLMSRLLLVSREGLCGEMLVWAEDRDTGVIGMIYTAPAWRRKGVASCLMEAARQYFYQRRIPEITADVRLRMTPVVRLLAATGYRQEQTLVRRPSISLDAPAPVKKGYGGR